MIVITRLTIYSWVEKDALDESVNEILLWAVNATSLTNSNTNLKTQFRVAKLSENP